MGLGIALKIGFYKIARVARIIIKGIGKIDQLFFFTLPITWHSVK